MPIRRGKAFLTSRRFQQRRIVKRQKISQPFLESRDEQEDQEPEHTFRFTEDDALDDTEDFSVEQESCSRKRKTKSYDEIKAAEIQKWVNLRTQLLNSWTKNLLPDKRSCSACFSEVGDIFLCPDCDLTNNNPLCKDCLSIKHSTCSLHLPKHLQGGLLADATIETTLDTETGCNCGNKYSRRLDIIDNKGRYVARTIRFCTCETEAVTLLRYKLWPSSPLRSNCAISTELLDFFIALQCEAHVSLNGFLNSLVWLDDHPSHKKKCIIKTLLSSESVEEYKHLKRKLSTIKYICPDYEGFENCPACPKQNGNVFYSVDANFGLVCKKSSGKSREPPKRSTEIFISDSEVDAYIGNCNGNVQKDELDCNNFQAGDKLRKASRTSALSVTGIFGVSCRHEFPKLFLNMKHGERIGYSLLCLEKLHSESMTKNNKLHFLYDIACTLKSHIKKIGDEEKYANVSFGIPVFHCYGHKAACQVLYNPRRLNGYGLLDGELVERLWSYMRPFPKITKEMTLSHRQDLLADAFAHFSRGKSHNIAKRLESWLQKANTVKENCRTELDAIRSKLEVAINDAVIEEWKSEEDRVILQKSATRKPSSVQGQNQWKQDYFSTLKEYFVLRNQLELSVERKEILQTVKRKRRCERKLDKIEKTNSIRQRWSLHDDQYKHELELYRKGQMEIILQKMFKSACERHFLLGLIKRYSDGQSIAARLQKTIIRVNAALKNMLASYNECTSESSGRVAFVDAGNPDSGLYAHDEGNSLVTDQSSVVPSSIKRKLVDLKNRELRAIEEEATVKGEMVNTVCYWHEQYDVLESKLKSEGLSDSVRSILLSRICFLRTMIVQLHNCFEQHVDGLPPFTPGPIAALHDTQTESDLQSEESDTDSDSELCEESDLVTDSDSDTM